MLISIERNPSRRQLTVFAAAWAVFFGICGLAAGWNRGLPAVGGLLAAVALLVPAAGLVWPAFLRIVYVGMSYATFPIGLAVSFVLLAVVYYLVLTPIGLVGRLFGYDPMRRRFEPGAKTYWSPREPEKPADRYFRQF